MAKVNFTQTSISSGLLSWSVDHTSKYEYSELNVFKYIKLSGKISNN